MNVHTKINIRSHYTRNIFDHRFLLPYKNIIMARYITRPNFYFHTSKEFSFHFKF
jgi:hypothetical protein